MVKKLSKSNNSLKSYEGLSTDFSIYEIVEETVVKIIFFMKIIVITLKILIKMQITWYQKIGVYVDNIFT